uniref:Uncharacterized protein LOC111111113 n=1 Tax=Crassostrea virginica TaxID=6565 RepID=A0A8B8BJX5_CRAVI|nr:uncharacterized protein LOC111111113 [Crassostrea virginica]
MSDDPGPSLAPKFSLTKSAENYCRLCQLIMTVCSDLFRDILSRYIKPADLRRELNNNKNTLLRALKIPDHKRLLFPQSGGQSLSAKDMDLTILYTLLRNICGIPKHQNGWGNTPKIGDMSLAACIERIREQKNSIASHNNIGEIDDNRFHDAWKELQNDIVNIESLLTGGDMYERRVIELHSCDLTSTMAIESAEEFKRLYDKMNEVQTETKQINAQKKARINVVVKRQYSFKRKLIGAKASKKARIFRLEKKQASSTSDIKEQLKDTEQHILHMVQGRFTGIKEHIEGRFSTNEQKIGGRLFGIERYVHGSFAGIQQQLAGSFSGIQQQLAGCFAGLQQLAGSFSGIQQQQAGLLPTMEKKIDERMSAMEEKMNNMKSRCFPLVLTSTIKVPSMFGINHISVVSPDKLWVSKWKKLQQVDSTGHVIRTLDDKYKYNSGGGSHTVSVEGDLVFIARVHNSVQFTASDLLESKDGIHKMTSDGSITTLLRKPDLHVLPISIHSSRINGDILIGLYYYSLKGKVMRCDGTGRKIGDIEFDEEGERLYKEPHYITENRINGDIVVSDDWKNALVVVDKSGRHRFDYKGHSTDQSFCPLSVCTDLLGHILVVHTGTNDDLNDVCCISLIDQDGRFLTRLLTEQGEESLSSLYVDDNYNIYVAYKDIIKVFR